MGNIVITGSNGQLGSEFRTLLSGRKDVFFTDIQELDICNIEDVDKFIIDNNISTIINCAAYTNVDKAEEEQDLSFKINAEGPLTLANSAAKHNATLIHISTDYVFDGKKPTPYHESDKCNPKNVYGKSKRLGETNIQKSGCKSIIIRTAWLYSQYGKNFVKTIIRLGMENEEIKVVSDQFGTPTFAQDLAKAIIHIIPQIEKRPRYGEVFNYTNEGSCSWFEFASKIIKLERIECTVLPIDTLSYPTAAERPKNSILDKSLIRINFDVDTPNWEKSLIKMLKQLE